MKADRLGFLDTVEWDRLEHAYGSASDLPELLRRAAAVRGPKLLEVSSELSSRVLHQRTIYSASPPVVRALIALACGAAPTERVVFYEFLADFAEAARTAIPDGRAIPGHSQSDPAHGSAILGAILEARSGFAEDLEHPDPRIRCHAAKLLTATKEAEPAIGSLVRYRYFIEPDTAARHAMLEGLDRLRGSIEDWPAFLATALGREDAPANRFLLRYGQLREHGRDAGSASVDELVEIFGQTGPGSDPDPHSGSRFLEAVRWLGPERELHAILKAIELTSDQNRLLVLTQHLLRCIFNDQRSGWEHTGCRRPWEDRSEPPRISLSGMLLRSVAMLLILKLFPWILRRRVRTQAAPAPRNIANVEYRGLQGDAPVLPPQLSETQRTALTALAGKAPLWEFRTNLWQLFGLPDRPDELLKFAVNRR